MFEKTIHLCCRFESLGEKEKSVPRAQRKITHCQPQKKLADACRSAGERRPGSKTFHVTLDRGDGSQLDRRTIASRFQAKIVNRSPTITNDARRRVDRLPTRINSRRFRTTECPAAKTRDAPTGTGRYGIIHANPFVRNNSYCIVCFLREGRSPNRICREEAHENFRSLL